MHREKPNNSSLQLFFVVSYLMNNIQELKENRREAAGLVSGRLVTAVSEAVTE